MCRGELHGEEVLLGRCATDDEGDMVGRTSGGAECLHLLHHEGHQRVGVEQRLGLLVEVGLVGRAATLGHAEEVILHALGSLDVDLCGEVATGVHLVVHVERSVLRVAQVLLGIGLVNAQRESLLIAEASPYLLALLTMDDGRTRVLAQGELALGRHFGIAQEGERYILVVVAGLGVAENLRHLLVVGTAEEERHVAESGVGHSS